MAIYQPPAGTRRRMVRLGSYSEAGRPVSVWAEVRLEPHAKGPRLAITHESRGSAGWLSFGAGTEEYRRVTRPAPGWTLERIARLAEVADRWHLNDMRAGCEHQRALGWQSCSGYPGPHCPIPVVHDYRAVNLTFPRSERQPVYSEPVGNVGEEPYPGITSRGRVYYMPPGGSAIYCSDRLSQPCPECGYRFGHEWRYEALPDDVLAFVDGILSEEDNPQ